MAKVKVKTLVDAAARLGVIENTQAARVTYAAWLKRDPQAAQRPLTAAMPQSSSGGRNAGAGRTTGVHAAGATANDQTAYPAFWRRAVGAGHGHKVRGQSRVTQARD